MDFGTALGYGVGAAAGGLATSKYAEIESQITQDREAALNQIKLQQGADMQSQMRQQQVARVGAATQGLIDTDTATNAANFYNDGDEHPVDSMADEEKAQFAPTGSRLADLRRQAAVNTGDINPEQDATLTNRAEIQGLKNDAILQRSADALERAKDHDSIALQIAGMRQAIGDQKTPSDEKMIEYLKTNGMTQQEAQDRVLGTGAGATKDPIALSTQLASSLLSNGLRLPDDLKGKTSIAQYAMDQATAQITAAQRAFKSPAATPSATPAAAPAAPSRPPLSSFSK